MANVRQTFFRPPFAEHPSVMSVVLVSSYINKERAWLAF
jgi:hypothetical protein